VSSEPLLSRIRLTAKLASDPISTVRTIVSMIERRLEAQLDIMEEDEVLVRAVWRAWADGGNNRRGSPTRAKAPDPCPTNPAAEVFPSSTRAGTALATILPIGLDEPDPAPVAARQAEERRQRLDNERPPWRTRADGRSQRQIGHRGRFQYLG
jgi:hypothetical protein